jgi:stage II sporulation protein D
LSSSSHAAQQDPLRSEIRIGMLRPGGGYTVQTVAVEPYIARVLAGEAARDSRPAALEALAITIRTFALANRGRHGADGFDLCDQTHCQVIRTATLSTERAATATAGRVLLRAGVPAAVFYSASCGGRTEVPSAVWPGYDDPPYMPSQPDDACGGAPAWTADLDAADLTRALRAAGFKGDRLRELRVLSRNGSGRVARLSVAGFMPEEISGQDLRAVVGRTLGWQYLKSAAFELERSGDRYHFDGHGYGHGVGLCVIGSVNLALAGRTATEILNRYFPGLEIGIPGDTLTALARASRGPATSPPSPTSPAGRSPAPPAFAPAGAVALALPDEDEGERDAIVRLTGQARDDMARALGVSAPLRVTLRVHPTTASYERATSQPWFTSGAVVRGELHLLPLAVLRERGVLERTLRHELVHLMADPALGDRPAWVREGAALYFAGGRTTPSGQDSAASAPVLVPTRPSGPCPSDAELLQPVSGGALSNAFASALGCFARQIEGGKSWRTVK